MTTRHSLADGSMERDAEIQAARRLMSAVLIDALDVLAKPSARRLYDETWCWIMADDPSWPFSFCNVCEALDLEPERVRAAIAPPSVVSNPVSRSTRVVELRPYRLRAHGCE